MGLHCVTCDMPAAGEQKLPGLLLSQHAAQSLLCRSFDLLEGSALPPAWRECRNTAPIVILYTSHGVSYGALTLHHSAAAVVAPRLLTAFSSMSMFQVKRPSSHRRCLPVQ